MQTKTEALADHPKLSLRVAGYQIHAVPTGIFALDGGAMFGTVPRVLWQKSNPPDEFNRIPMEARALLLKSNKKIILIDNGNGSDFVAKYGEKLGTKFSEMYGVDKSGPNLISSLKKCGVQVEDVTDVILTHLHFDHCGGSTCERNGKIVPTFPNAKYHVQKANYETALKPNVREKASYLTANFAPLMEAGVLNLVEGNIENYFPGISLWVSNGHTVGHQVVRIADADQQLIYCGDVIPTSSHIRSAWIMGYDLEPLKIIREKSEVLKWTDSKKSYLFFEHDPYCDVATVEKNNDEYKALERFHLS